MWSSSPGRVRRKSENYFPLPTMRSVVAGSRDAPCLLVHQAARRDGKWVASWLHSSKHVGQHSWAEPGRPAASCCRWGAGEALESRGVSLRCSKAMRLKHQPSPHSWTDERSHLQSFHLDLTYFPKWQNSCKHELAKTACFKSYRFTHIVVSGGKQCAIPGAPEGWTDLPREIFWQMLSGSSSLFGRAARDSSCELCAHANVLKVLAWIPLDLARGWAVRSSETWLQCFGWVVF